MASTTKNGTERITAAHIRRAVECIGSLSGEQAYDELKSLANQAADEIERLNGEADGLRADNTRLQRENEGLRGERDKATRECVRTIWEANSCSVISPQPASRATLAPLDMLPDGFEVVIRRKDGRP
jgi:FtsZ-binding cell division protein ZapB